MGGLFDIVNLKKRLEELTKKINEEDFWQDFDQANKINQEYLNIKKKVDYYTSLEDSINILDAFQNELDVDKYQKEYEDLEKDINELSNLVHLNGEYDELNCYLEIHPGAGGTESCDWASMLKRMYERFAEKNDFKCEIIDELKGEEAGLKSVTLKINGLNAYGLLKNETGVHRLVRISPFDAGKRRHTSFAAVSVIPEFENDINIEVKEEDLKIDVFHSSGAGGQSVNTSNSAVRITHLPSKIVVSCQVERSQLKNKELAMKMLKNKLYLKKLEEQAKTVNDIKKTDVAIDFGSQIRSYIMEPYKLVKDHRTQYENSDPDKILDGNIKEMLLYNLHKLVSEKNE